MKFTNGDDVRVLSGEYKGMVGTIGGYDVDAQKVEVIFIDSDTHIMISEDELELAGHECAECGDYHE